ncbi:MAG TPA: SAM-dependent methyltransferase [Cryomorphaceae bacterium]|nr:SAM-dependent methyltransferase [Owenweeksia sp.]HAD96772.1 SAM-dependent methyltransferase [Cryomorphaceae bacterium]HBF19442.1 SAM-dependent methyltransferase [Cryomorphaceae bacterium]HCQ15557.1 SAM-dependent methyltransferase [Cryomorphaceae bacterium]|tara:strand:- start:413 stop:1003 length:591 start_codon:yes stop_codon:yes gene_type:complete
MNSTNEKYWAEHYDKGNTPWDMGTTSPPLTAYFQGLHDKTQAILIPGAGTSHEAEWLWHNGFKNVWVADIAAEPLQKIRERCPSFPEEQLIHGDFFALNRQFDLVVEQTFFCALPPEWRPRYVQKMKDILKEGGHLVGVLFDFPLTEQGPPYGGGVEEYRELFSPYFKIWKMERCYNSIKPRAGKEIFINLIQNLS